MNEVKLFAFFAIIVLKCSFVICTFKTASFVEKEVQTDKKPATEEEMMMLLKALSHVQMDETDVSSDRKKGDEPHLVDDSKWKEDYVIPKHKKVEKSINIKPTGVNIKTLDPQELVKTLGNKPSSDTLKSVLNLIKEHNVSIYSTNFDYIINNNCEFNGEVIVKSEKSYFVLALLIILILQTWC